MPYKDKGIQRERQRAYSKKHYQENKTYYLQKTRRSEVRKYEYILSLKDVPCADCGVRYPHYVMEFDHTGDNKKFPLARGRNHTWRQIEEEVAKCEVVCANCHAVRTHFRRNGGTEYTEDSEASASA